MRRPGCSRAWSSRHLQVVSLRLKSWTSLSASFVFFFHLCMFFLVSERSGRRKPPAEPPAERSYLLHTCTPPLPCTGTYSIALARKLRGNRTSQPSCRLRCVVQWTACYVLVGSLVLLSKAQTLPRIIRRTSTNTTHEYEYYSVQQYYSVQYSIPGTYTGV